MRFGNLLVGVAGLAAIAAAAPASAVVLVTTTASGGNAINPIELSSSQISVDFDIAAFAPITLGFAVQAGDAATYNFDSAVNIFTGVNASAAGVESLVLGLTNGATFNLGTVSPSFSRASTSLSAAGNALTVRFTPAETNGVVLGSLDTLLGDFGINRNGLTSGQNFALTLSAVSPVPEPSSWVMMFAGLGLAAGGLRRGRNQRSLKLA